MISSAPSAATATSQATAEGGTQGLGRDAFLKLLITQIQMQDPLEPLKAENFVAQLAQFSSVEQLQSANLQLTILQHAEATSQALALIGHSVTTGDGGAAGVVQAVVFSEGQPKLLVGSQEVDPSDVTRVW